MTTECFELLSSQLFSTLQQFFFQVLVHVYLQKSCRIFVYLFIHQVIQLGSANDFQYIHQCHAMFCQNQSYKCEISVLKSIPSLLDLVSNWAAKDLFSLVTSFDLTSLVDTCLFSV